MIIKKLAAPLINDKILQQAEHCYIATTSLSSSGFDFIRTRIPAKTKLSIVTGADEPISPEILRNILKHYQERIIFTLYTRNYFHANVFIFDLPFRKSVAFVGTGHLTLGGLKDQEEIFYKVTDGKEVEALKSWFTGYFEFGEPLSEKFIDQYELIYPRLKRRQIDSRMEKREVSDLASRAFSWETIKFKHQYFKREDYEALAPDKVASLNPIIVEKREAVRAKFTSLLTALRGEISSLGFKAEEKDLLPVDPSLTKEGTIRRIGISILTSSAFRLEIVLSQKEFSIFLYSDAGDAGAERDQIRQQLTVEDYRKAVFQNVQSMGKKYTIEIAGDRRWLDLFQSAELLAEFIREDDWRFGRFVIGKSFQPGDAEVSTEAIASTAGSELKKLVALYHQLLTVKTS